MSFDLVNDAATSPAFDATPPPETLAECHVPFKELTGDDIEKNIASRLENYDRIALVGPIGSGKSSIARYLLRPNGQSLAPIWINVATEKHDLISEVRGFLEILVAQLLSKAKRANQLGDNARRELLRKARQSEPLGRDEKKIGVQLGGSYWLLQGGVAGEITRAFDHGDAYRSTEDLRQAVVQALAILSDSKLIPVLVADDTDRLLRVSPDDAVNRKLFEGFFGEVVREIANQLECGLLVAVHNDYIENAEYDRLNEGRLSPVELPILDSPKHFASLIDARVAFIDENAAWDDLVAPDGLDRLCELHMGDHARSVRRTLTTLREALGLAASQSADTVGALHVDAASAS